MLKKRIHRASAVFIFNSEGKVLLLKHKKLNSWLPPGGHIEEGELTHLGAIREVLEEVGIKFTFISETSCIGTIAEPLPVPIFIQLEDLGDHYHEDFLYVGVTNMEPIDLEGHGIGWFSIKEDCEPLQIFDHIYDQLRYLKDNGIVKKAMNWFS